MNKTASCITLSLSVLLPGFLSSAKAGQVLSITQLKPPKVTPEQLSERSQTPLQDIEQEIVKEINEYRATKGLPPLKWNPEIAQQARRHSQNMASQRVPFGHQGFQQRVEILRSEFPYRGSAAENVAFNSGYRNPAKQAVEGWLKSPGHRKNIEGQYTFTGIGVSRGSNGEYYLTQLFVQK
jgi:uncharacterized protein YkwD